MRACIGLCVVIDVYAMNHAEQEEIRAIVREELARVLGIGVRVAHARGHRPAPAPVASEERRLAIERFVLTLVPGERVTAAALFARWQAWAVREAPEAAGVTGTAFGRVAGRLPGLTRYGAARRVYVRAERAMAAGCAGEAGCPHPMLKGRDVCAQHAGLPR